MNKINRYFMFFLIFINITCLITVLIVWGEANNVLNNTIYKPFIFWSGAFVNFLILSGIWMVLDMAALLYFKLKRRK